jgi:hypothetical protein
MAKRNWVDRALIVCPFYIGLCTSKKEFRSVCKDLKVTEPPEFLNRHADAMVHFFERKSKLAAVVCIRRRKDRTRPQMDAMLVHEAVHIWQQTVKELKEHDPSDEFEAYSIQTISQRLIEAYWSE